MEDDALPAGVSQERGILLSLRRAPIAVAIWSTIAQLTRGGRSMMIWRRASRNFNAGAIPILSEAFATRLRRRDQLLRSIQILCRRMSRGGIGVPRK